VYASGHGVEHRPAVASTSRMRSTPERSITRRR